MYIVQLMWWEKKNPNFFRSALQKGLIKGSICLPVLTCSLISFQEKPKVFLTLEELAKENTPNFGTELKDEDIPPLFVSDVQSLILFAVQGSACKIKPRYNCLLLFLERGFTLNWSVTLASHIRAETLSIHFIWS